jgi:excisionase family DNA binding protein
MLLTTKEVAAFLKVHPKHVYRLRKRGLPAHRVGDEWRFDEEEVRRHCRGGGEEAPASAASVDRRQAAPPLLAANGDVAIDVLLDEARAAGAPLVGLVQVDHGGGLALLRRGAVLVAGCHGGAIPKEIADLSLVRIHVTDREVGLAFPRGKRLQRVSAVVGRRLASRPPSAGIRAHLDAALHAAGIDPVEAHAGGALHRSHRDVAMAVLRGEAEVGLCTRAWSVAAGLAFHPLASEPYGLVLRADDLGDPRVLALCELVQSGSYRKKLRGDLGYEPRRSGEIRVSAARAGAGR